MQNYEANQNQAHIELKDMKESKKMNGCYNASAKDINFTTNITAKSFSKASHSDKKFIELKENVRFISHFKNNSQMLKTTEYLLNDFQKSRGNYKNEKNFKKIYSNFSRISNFVRQRCKNKPDSI